MHIPFFRIFYSTTFTILSLVLIVLLAITPGDAIYQAYKNSQLYNVFVIAGAYFLTFLLALLIYSTRLFVTRNHLQSIPRSWIPIEKADVTKDVRRMIVDGLAASAAIAWRAHPRERAEVEKETILSQNVLTPTHTAASQQTSRHASGETRKETSPTPSWGVISHPGWSSPDSALPNINFESIILELPHLIEAKAVSLAPVVLVSPALQSPMSPVSRNQQQEPIPTADPVALFYLRRPVNACLRAYVTRLVELSVLPPTPLPQTFLALYERARFSEKPLLELEFERLMSVFADLLHSIEPLSAQKMMELRSASDEDSETSRSSQSREGSYVSGTTSSATSSFRTMSRSASIHSTATVEHHTLPPESPAGPSQPSPGMRDDGTTDSTFLLPCSTPAGPSHSTFHTPLLHPENSTFANSSGRYFSTTSTMLSDNASAIHTPASTSYFDLSEGSLAGSEGTARTAPSRIRAKTRHASASASSRRNFSSNGNGDGNGSGNVATRGDSLAASIVGSSSHTGLASAATAAAADRSSSFIGTPSQPRKEKARYSARSAAPYSSTANSSSRVPTTDAGLGLRHVGSRESESSVLSSRTTNTTRSGQRSGSGSGSGGSVIRLAEAAGPLDLPYVITTIPTREWELEMQRERASEREEANWGGREDMR
ncbi:hypothetical protein MMC25_006576 [Agyrium rufum]|nr:hypothetical protein [Agyrium rufum]